jgi:hypothetical protein
MHRLFIGFCILLISGEAKAEVCDRWFEKSKLVAGPSCLGECVALPVGMESFDCPLACPDLCKRSLGTKFGFNLAHLYPSLTDAERVLFADDPGAAAQAYYLSWRAEKSCNGLYGSSRTNDESDACRHYVWAALLRRDLGLDRSRAIMDAHESEPGQPVEEKAMDLANNQRGILYVESLAKTGEMTEDGIIKAFLKDLEKGNIVVLKPLRGNK